MSAGDDNRRSRLRDRNLVSSLVQDFERLEEAVLPLPEPSGHYCHSERVLRKKRASVVRGLVSLALEVAINQPERARVGRIQLEDVE